MSRYRKEDERTSIASRNTIDNVNGLKIQAQPTEDEENLLYKACGLNQEQKQIYIRSIYKPPYNEAKANATSSQSVDKDELLKEYRQNLLEKYRNER